MLIILPSQRDQLKTFHARHVPAQIHTGVVRGHLPAIIVAANCLTAAKRLGCEEIVVELEGMLPRRYAIRDVEREIRRNPLRFIGWIPRLARTPAEREHDVLTRRYMRGKPGEIRLG